MKKVCLLGIAMLSLLQLFGQQLNPEQRAQLNELAQAYNDAFQENLLITQEKALLLDIPLVIDDGDDGKIYLDHFEGEFPVYIGKDNAISVRTVSADKIKTGGISGLNLDGSGVLMGVWDENAVRHSHQEFGNRTSQGDAESVLSNHATHVAGTMAAAGTDPSAAGFCNQSTLATFDWTNDNSEMASAAANTAMTNSNHSYGYITGWRSGTWYGDVSVSTLEDWKFGAYTGGAREWDVIVKNAPQFLIFKSAGNDRGDAGDGSHPIDGGADGFDCIGQRGNAKNIITIGAVQDIPAGYNSPADVVAASFSSWGPADDGRIKPDVVANGISLYSPISSSDNAYASFSGTSMSSPSAAGVAGLLQQHYKSTTGQFADAATMKGLLIHGADEAGPNPGPDYMFGWGLINAQTSADLITESAANNDFNIQNLVANPGTDILLNVDADGGEPLKVTIVWTDEPGAAVSQVLDDLTPTLVNNLDLRISRSGTTTFPWKLNPIIPAQAATRSDNNVDNVEQVLIPNPVAGGTYEISISPPSNIVGGTQDFALIISGGTGGTNTPCTLGTSYSTSVGATASTSIENIVSNGQWTASETSPWLSLNNTSGNGNAPLSFSYTTNTAATTRTAVINITCGGATQSIIVNQAGVPVACAQQYASLPYSTGFESGLDAFWCTSSSNNFGRIQVTSANGPNSGTSHLTMDSNTNANFALNEGTLGLQLDGKTGVKLNFYWKEFGDENNTQDGVFFSNNGGASYVKVHDLINGSTVYQMIELDVNALAAAAGLTLTNNFVVKFQQYDNYSITTDGFAFDDISVTEAAPVCTLGGPGSISFDHTAQTANFNITSNGTWTVSENLSWLTLNTTSGTGNQAVSFNLAANPTQTIRAGSISISCGATTIAVVVSQGTPPLGCTQQYAPLPYSTGFESGLDQYWCTSSSNSFGRIEVTSDFEPQSGTSHLTMDSNTNTNFATNQAELGLQLSGKCGVKLQFWFKEFGDETNVEDGIFLSDDGGNTYSKVNDLIGSTSYVFYDLDLEALAAANGLSLNNQFVVKFQQYDNYSITTDGFAFDNIAVTSSDCGGNNCYVGGLFDGFEDGLSNWVQDTNDDFDWIINSGGTTSQNTGPTGAYSGSNYVYVEASAPNYPSKTAILESQCYDLSAMNSPKVSYQLHQYGAAMGTLFFEGNIGNGWVTIYTSSLNQTSWPGYSYPIELLGTDLSNVRFRFRAITGTSFTSDMAIDHFQIYDSNPLTGEDPGNGGVVSGVEDIDFNISSFPNPFSDQVTIKYSIPEEMKITVTLMDITGKIVLQPVRQEQKYIGEHYLELDVRNLAAGMYYYRVRAGDSFKTGKIIKR